MMLDLDKASMDGPLLKRAKATVRRRELPPRERNFIQKPLLILLMRKALMESDKIAAMLYLTAYTFPSSYVFRRNACRSQRLGTRRHSCAR